MHDAFLASDQRQYFRIRIQVQHHTIFYTIADGIAQDRRAFITLVSMYIWFGAFFLQSFYYIGMRGQIRTADTEINNILSLFVQLIYLPQFLREIIFAMPSSLFDVCISGSSCMSN